MSVKGELGEKIELRLNKNYMNMFMFLFYKLAEREPEKKIRIFLSLLKQMTETLDFS